MKVWNRSEQWGIPPGAVYVGRPTKWGNPYNFSHGNREQIITMYEDWIATQRELLSALDELRGKDLVCWCAPLACHADVLMRLANER